MSDTSEKPYDSEIVSVGVAGDLIETTLEHPFYVLDADLRDRLAIVYEGQPNGPPVGQWIAAGDLRVGDTVLLGNGECAEIEGITREVNQLTVYNLTVAGTHTFTVGRASVLVHNSCGDVDPVPVQVTVEGRRIPGVDSPNPARSAEAGEDLYVGTYSRSYYGNQKTGLNYTHTPHHAVQDAISYTTHGRGITINLRKDLHELTRTFSRPVDHSHGYLPGSWRSHLGADVRDLRNILRDAGYDQRVINRQLRELIRQNKELMGM